MMRNKGRGSTRFDKQRPHQRLRRGRGRPASAHKRSNSGSKTLSASSIMARKPSSGCEHGTRAYQMTQLNKNDVCSSEPRIPQLSTNWMRESHPSATRLGLLSSLLRNHRCAVRRRRAFAMTDTELSDIASAATTGLSRMPKVG